MIWRTKRAGGNREPEMRLPFGLPGFILGAVGILIFGVQLQNTAAGHWVRLPSPLSGTSTDVFSSRRTSRPSSASPSPFSARRSSRPSATPTRSRAFPRPSSTASRPSSRLSASSTPVSISFAVAVSVYAYECGGNSHCSVLPQHPVRGMGLCEGGRSSLRLDRRRRLPREYPLPLTSHDAQQSCAVLPCSCSHAGRVLLTFPILHPLSSLPTSSSIPPFAHTARLPLPHLRPQVAPRRP